MDRPIFQSGKLLNRMNSKRKKERKKATNLDWLLIFFSGGKVGNVPVSLSFVEKNSDVLVRYAHFDSNLTHDPSLGFPTSSTIGWLVIAIIVGCILVLGLFLGGLILWSRHNKKSGYEQL